MVALKMWRLRSAWYDVIEASDTRRGAAKATLFSRMVSPALLIAAGTGIDFRHLPAGQVVAVDYSPHMLRRARRRMASSPASIALLSGDAHRLPFADATFRTVILSCTMCSVEDPARVCAELRRVLRPDGRLLLFEHVRSRQWALGLMLDMMTLWTRAGGTYMNRHTLRTLAEQGFEIVAMDSVFLDIIVAAEARVSGTDAARTAGQAA
jgi:ubiquinone/menaquinone biosynthesis C-methylase UbiE